MKNDMIECQRCGICCIVALCSHGKPLENGVCRFLEKHSDYTSCRLLVEGKVEPEDIGIGKGCVLRRSPAAFSYYQQRAQGLLSTLMKKRGLKVE